MRIVAPKPQECLLTQFFVSLELEVEREAEVTGELGGVLVLQIVRDVDSSTRDLSQACSFIILASAIMIVAKWLFVFIFEQPAVFGKHQVVRDVNILRFKASCRCNFSNYSHSMTE